MDAAGFASGKDPGIKSGHDSGGVATSGVELSEGSPKSP